MSIVVGVVAQKGGVGKSTLARMIAVEYARSGWNTRIADMDTSQSTARSWQLRRLQNDVSPEISVETFATVKRAMRTAEQYDLIVFDGAPAATKQTLEIAQTAQMTFIPTGIALDDLEPTVRLANELHTAGIPKEKIAIVLCRVGNSPVELQEARDYVGYTDFHLVEEALPDKTVYRRASDAGRALTETTHQSTNQRALAVMREMSALISRQDVK